MWPNACWLCRWGVCRGWHAALFLYAYYKEGKTQVTPRSYPRVSWCDQLQIDLPQILMHTSSRYGQCFVKPGLVTPNLSCWRWGELIGLYFGCLLIWRFIKLDTGSTPRTSVTLHGHNSSMVDKRYDFYVAILFVFKFQIGRWFGHLTRSAKVSIMLKIVKEIKK